MRRRPPATRAHSPIDRMRDVSAPARVYVLSVEAVAVVAVVTALILVEPSRLLGLFTRPELYLVAALVVVADMYPWAPWMRDVRGRVRMHFSGTFALALALIGGPPALLLFPLIALSAQNTMRTACWRRCFNVAVLTLEAAGGFLALHLIFQPWPEAPTAAQLFIGGIVAGAVWEVVNMTAVCTAIILVDGTGLRDTVILGWRRTAPWLAALVAAPVVAYLALTAPILLPGLGLLTIVIHHAFAATVRSSDDARTDQLTGLANRTAAMERLDELLAPGRTRSRVAVMMVDLDGFKAVNDTFGHDSGDHVLVDVASRIRGAVPDDLLVARLGGDEFVAVGEVIADPDLTVARVRDAVRRPVALPGFGADGPVVELTCSIGLVASGGDIQPLDVLRMADRNMYQDKASRASVELGGPTRPSGRPARAPEPEPGIGAPGLLEPSQEPAGARGEQVSAGRRT